MELTITSEVVVAYSQCPRKAYLLLFSPDKGEPHEYVQILEQQRCANQERYLHRLQQTHADVQPYSLENLHKGSKVLINAQLQVDRFAADCGVLTRVEGTSTFGKYSYEPSLFVGTHSISKEQQLELSFVGHVLEGLQHTSPAAGRIIGMDGKSHTVKLGASAKALRPLLEPLHEWITVDSPKPPPLVLNKHCPLCPFQRRCHAQAEQEDNLSLLNGVTARVMRQYEKKGIFTVKQLSYLFKPRKRKKGNRKSSPVTHKVELQALAIREKKIYLQELPTLSRQPVELFVDMEGVPDRGLYYLIGLLVCQGDTTEHYAFWADTDRDERHVWQQFVEKVAQYPEAPIYHYGSYEPRAIATLAKRYQTDAQSLLKRLVNVNGYIYGKVYFPVRSNGLKDIGHCIGAKWTSPIASGLQSLVWRHYWEETKSTQFQELLVTYNSEDYWALKHLIDELSKIIGSANILTEVNFVDQSKNQSTETKKELHNHFESMLKFAHADYSNKKIRLKSETTKNSANETEVPEPKTASNKPKIFRKPNKTIQVPHLEFCPQCNNQPLHDTKKTYSTTITDLILTKNGLRKAIVRCRGTKGQCLRCNKLFGTDGIGAKGRPFLYGRGFNVWLCYQRIMYRQSYENIIKMTEDIFDELLNRRYVIRAIDNFTTYYAETETKIISQVLQGTFIHADETKINICGTNWYVWVFTNGKYVTYKLTETREPDIVHEFLRDYKGVLISDFYKGYDSVKCTQQKCWVHLIRDLNNDLWDAPYDTELEKFISEVQGLMVEIIATVNEYGLKVRHLKKHQNQVDRFYSRTIFNKIYKSDLVNKYQKRFINYQESLFTFLKLDGIPWHNNTAENAIRHFALQRNISGSFHESGAHNYLLFLGIYQSCRYQGKSFYKFLFSGETDLDKFEARKRKRSQVIPNDGYNKSTAPTIGV